MYTLLSIDAGGARGVIVAKKLEYLETEASRILGEPIRIAQLFDILIGTSIGSVLSAMYLQCDKLGAPRYSAKEVCQLFIANDNTLLTTTESYNTSDVFSGANPKYKIEQMLSHMDTLFGTQRLQDLYKPLLIPVFDLTTQRTMLLDRHNAASVNLSTMVAATCSSPCYFDPVELRLDNQTKILAADAMLTNYNPALLGFGYLINTIQKTSTAQILTTSFGTGFRDFSNSPDQISDWDDRNWDAMHSTAATLGIVQSEHQILEQIYSYHASNYWRFNPKFSNSLPEFDGVTEKQFSELLSTADKEIEFHSARLNKLAQVLVQRYAANNDGVATDHFDLLFHKKPQLIQRPKGAEELLNLGNYIDTFCRKHASNTALQSFGKTIKYSDLGRLSNDVCAWLQFKGFTKGDRIALMAPNCMSYLVILFGILKAGCIAVPINPQYTVSELNSILEDSESKLVFIWEGSANVLQQTQYSKLPAVIVRLGNLLGLKGAIVDGAIRFKGLIKHYKLASAIPFKGVLREAKQHERCFVTVGINDIALFQYTGGTTGQSKAAMLSHGNLLSNILQVEHFLPQSFCEYEKQITSIAALPMYHIFALLLHGLLLPKYGARNILITNPRDITALVAILRQPFHLFAAVNTLFIALLNDDKFKEIDFEKVHLVIGGGAAVHSETAKKMLEVSGHTIIQAYGLTEASPGVSVMPLDAEFNSSIGKNLLHTETAIIDDNGRLVKDGVVGELLVKGPQVMCGYWRGELPTGEQSNDRWLRTGDLVYRDSEGFLFLVDRKKDMILVSGFNVYPNEIENRISEHEDVLDCGCTGVPDARSGQIVKAYVVKKHNSTLTAELLIEWCRQSLTNYKVPRYIEFVAELPKSNVGKVLRRKLAESTSQP